MFLEVIINDIKNWAEELGAGITLYVLWRVDSMPLLSELVKFVMNIIAPIIVAYLVHKLKKNYWETDRPFFKNVIGDIRKLWKK